MTERKLTDEQVENWRKALLGMIGPYARIMPVEKIEEIRDNMASRFPGTDGSTSEPEPLPYEVGDVVWVDGRTKAYVVKISPSKTQIKWGWGGRSFVDNNRIKTEKS